MNTWSTEQLLVAQVTITLNLEIIPLRKRRFSPNLISEYKVKGRLTIHKVWSARRVIQKSRIQLLTP